MPCYAAQNSLLGEPSNQPKFTVISELAENLHRLFRVAKSKRSRQGHFTESFYVAGFMARRRRRYNDAIEFYRKAIEYGRGGVAVYRELAVCYFEN
jgi:hypothetical protein